MKGTIADLPITMDLVQMKGAADEYEPYIFSGHYYYDKYQQPIALYGEFDSVGNIILHESHGQDEDMYFTGKFDVSGSLSGTWCDTASKRTLAFALKETAVDGAIAFDFHMFEDSVKGWEHLPNSPIGSFDMQLLLPDKNTEGGIAAFLKNRILMGISNDTIEKSYTKVSLDAFKNAKRDTFFTDYLAAAAEEKPDSTGLLPAMLNHAQSSSVAVIFNENKLLSLGFAEYSYSGGAHGNHATGIATYDLAQKKALTLSNIFLPKYEKVVKNALTNAVRRHFKLTPKESLSSVLFDNTIEPTNNFCITQKGILFLYNPYEIAAYAMGEIELFIPFEEVKSVVNPRFLQ